MSGESDDNGGGGGNDLSVSGNAGNYSPSPGMDLLSADFGGAPDDYSSVGNSGFSNSNDPSDNDYTGYEPQPSQWVDPDTGQNWQPDQPWQDPDTNQDWNPQQTPMLLGDAAKKAFFNPSIASVGRNLAANMILPGAGLFMSGVDALHDAYPSTPEWNAKNAALFEREIDPNSENNLRGESSDNDPRRQPYLLPAQQAAYIPDVAVNSPEPVLTPYQRLNQSWTGNQFNLAPIRRT